MRNIRVYFKMSSSASLLFSIGDVGLGLQPTSQMLS